MNKPQIPIRSMAVQPPTKTEIIKARKLAGCTIKEAAIAVCVPTAYWRDCEAGIKPLHPGLALLFKLTMLKDKV